MSATFQGFPPPGPTPPGMIYPTTATSSNSGQQGTSDHSSGSFGMVFVVLAIILVVSAVACVLGRFCSKRANKSHQPKAHKQSHKNKHGHGHEHEFGPGPGRGHSHKHMNHPTNHKGNNHHGQKHGHGGGRPRDPDLEFGFRSKEGDIMLGFDPKTRVPPSAKVANHGDFRGHHGMGSQGRGMDHHGEPGDFV